MSLKRKKVWVQNRLQSLEAQLSLPECPLENEKRICVAVMERKLLKGKSPKIVAAASLYACHRMRRSPIGLRELARTSDVSCKEIGRGYRSIVLSLGITPPGVDEEGYVAGLAERTHKSEEAIDLAQAIIREAVRKALGGRNPMTRATAALYIACLSIGENATQAELASVAGVTEDSVRGCIKTFRRAIDIPAPFQRDGLLIERAWPFPAPSSFAQGPPSTNLAKIHRFYCMSEHC
jgi:transcription initiation factor TFIIB